MSRRSPRHDRVAEKATDALVAPQLDETLALLPTSLSRGQRHLLQAVANGASTMEIAQTFGLSSAEVRRDVAAVLERLSAAVGSDEVTGWLDGVTSETLTAIAPKLERSVLRSVEPQELRWCDHHGWTQTAGMPTCGGCTCEIPIEEVSLLYKSSFGRPRKYCSNACRQRAYRHRHAGGQDTASMPTTDI